MKRFLSFALALILLLGALPARAAENEIAYTGTVTSSSLHLRKSPNASATVLNTYKKGTQVTVLENDGEWCKVQIGKRTGYMMTQYLDITANYTHLAWGKTPDDGTVLSIRGGAGKTFPIIAMGMSGGVYELIEEMEGWYKIRLGERFGYIEKAKVQRFEGDFALGFKAPDAGGALSAAYMYSALREAGSQLTMSKTEGDFTYSIAYPSLDIPAADQKMSAWVKDRIAVFEKDFQENHLGAQGSFTVEYQSLRIDDRYVSVLLFGEYRVGALKAETALAVNVDTETGRVLEPKDLFTSLDWPLFCLESAAAALMSVGTDGYSGKPDQSWLAYAVLGRDGVQAVLPAGLYLPPELGSRKVTIKYQQVGEQMALSPPAISRHIRVLDPSKPMIALTFDDGPSEETERILAVLEEYNARATFCVIGEKVENYANVVKRTLAGGNEIASHTWSHPNLTKQSVATIRSQLERTNKVIMELTGCQIRVLRPPYGAVNKNVRSVCADLGMSIALWQVDTLDWQTRNTNKTYRALMKGAKDGVIVLFHDLYKTTASAAEKAIPELIEKGYQLVTVSELLSFHKDGAKPGATYTRVEPKDRVNGQ